MKGIALVLFLATACTPKDPIPDTGTPDTGTTDTGTPDTGTPDTGTPDTGETQPAEFPSISGDCGVLDSELTDAQFHPFANVLDFATDGFQPSALSESGTRILETDNKGGSSIYSEVYAFELLFHCESAILLKTETEISYTDTHGKITDLLVEIDGSKIGVSVTRAFAYPPETPYTAELATTLLNKKLNGILSSSANVAEEDAWEKQILHVLAYTADHSAQILSVFDDLPEEIKTDTILLVTTTEGDDAFLY
jgi:hypothetical protein